MAKPTKNESWIIETGDRVIQKKARRGAKKLTKWERLVYCLWVADYGMRNAGDLDTAADVYDEFHSEARRLSTELSLPLTQAAFSLSKGKLEREYFNRFELICEEIKQATE